MKGGVRGRVWVGVGGEWVGVQVAQQQECYSPTPDGATWDVLALVLVLLPSQFVG